MNVWSLVQCPVLFSEQAGSQRDDRPVRITESTMSSAVIKKHSLRPDCTKRTFSRIRADQPTSSEKCVAGSLIALPGCVDQETHAHIITSGADKKNWTFATICDCDRKLDNCFIKTLDCKKTMRCHGNNNARWREQWCHVDSDRFFSVNKVSARLTVNKFVDVVLSSYDYFQVSQISTDPPVEMLSIGPYFTSLKL